MHVSRGVSTGTDTGESTAFVPRQDTWTERRRVWRLELNAMRKVWAAEHQQRLDEKAARDAEKRRIIEIKKEELRQVKAMRRAAKAVVHQAKLEREARWREQDELEGKQRRAQREFVDHLRRTAREEELLNASRDWVTREGLDARIQMALDAPRKMY